MKTDIYGQQIYSEQDLVDAFMRDPEIVIERVMVDRDITFSSDLEIEKVPKVEVYTSPTLSMQEYDKMLQQKWFIPEEYKNFDIARWVLDRCSTNAELQRAGEELLLYQERDLFMLLRYLKYIVDTMREHGIVWGVGRGSSVASFVLYLIGVHRINSLYYDLSIREFLK